MHDDRLIIIVVVRERVCGLSVGPEILEAVYRFRHDLSSHHSDTAILDCLCTDWLTRYAEDLSLLQTVRMLGLPLAMRT